MVISKMAFQVNVNGCPENVSGISRDRNGDLMGFSPSESGFASVMELGDSMEINFSNNDQIRLSLSVDV